MKIVVTGATGNVGTSVLEVLSREAEVTEIIGVARRMPGLSVRKCDFLSADVAEDDLEPLFRGADAVIHLAWMVQPERNPAWLYRINVVGSRRVFAAALAAQVDTIVHASSVAAYAPAPRDVRVDEGWSTAGIPSSVYSRQKAAVEHELDELERNHPRVRFVRMRAGVIFKRQAASSIRRLFVSRLVSARRLGTRGLPFVPDVPELRFQGIHSLDVAQAYRSAVLSDVRGAFNLAAEPVLDSDVLAKAFRAPKIEMSGKMLRRLAAAAYRLRLQPTSPGWVDLALHAPLMDTTRARRELGFRPARSSIDALLELFEGLEEEAAMATAPLVAGR